jgi:hypothetical protein
MSEYRQQLKTLLGTAREAVRRAGALEPTGDRTEFDTNRIRRDLRFADGNLARIESELTAASAPAQQKQKQQNRANAGPSQSRESSASETPQILQPTPPKLST